VKLNYLSLSEVSRVIDVSPAVVASWLADGLLQTRLMPRGEEAVAELVLAHLLLRKGIALPDRLRHSLRLMVVDDEPAMLRSTARLLKRNAPHLDVSLAEGAWNGLHEIREHQPDAVLVDMCMPELSGVELCSRIKQLARPANVIVLAFSGRRDTELERDFKRAGGVALLDKPPDVQQLLHVLEVESIAESVA
jgi:CheY-like chemotaxis protein